MAHAQIAIFARLAKGGDAPQRLLFGQATKLSRTMHAISYSEKRYEFYVTNPFAQAVLAFRGGANGQEPPIRVIQGSKTHWDNPTTLAIDEVHNEILVPQKDDTLVFPLTADGDVAPLPVLHGAEIYAKKCAACHGPTGTSVVFHHRPLVGGKGTLTSMNAVKSIGSYWPFATTIWDFINRAMPAYPIAPPGVFGKEQGSSLSANEFYALTAFLLYQNEIIQETDLIDARTLPKIPMPNRNGFLPPEPME